MQLVKKYRSYSTILTLIFALLISNIAFSQNTPLPAKEAFQISVKYIDANNLAVHWKIHPQYHLYRSAVTFKITNPEYAQLGRILKPQGPVMQDEVLGKYQIYRNNIGIQIPVLGLRSGETKLLVHYQGCADSGFCYPPETKAVLLRISNDLRLTNAQLTQHSAPVSSPSNQFDNNNESTKILQSHNLFIIIISFLALGLLLSFTPCVLPMIPIISSIIVGHGENITTAKAFRLSLTYVFAMSFTYAIAGMFIATLGENLTSALQQPWVLILSALFFVLLALSMFGFYELKLPQSFEARIATISRHQQTGHYIGVAVMGVLATLIVSPCVTAPLVGVLAYIATSNDLQLGFIALFSLGFGMGIPLLVVGASAGKLLPKAGFWMNNIKAIFGVLLLAVAVNLLNRILPGPYGLMLWGILFISVAVYAIGNGHHKHIVANTFTKAIGACLLIYGTIMLIGAASGNDDPLQPLRNFAIGTQKPMTKNHFISVKTIADVQQQLKKAQLHRQPVLLDFYADWCLSCKVIERTTLHNEQVKALLDKFILLRADITSNDNNDIALKKHFGIIAPPSFVFFDKHGKHVRQADIVGEISAAEMIRHLQLILDEKQ